LAIDVMMYDQGGCLSPHTVFVEGAERHAMLVAEMLAEELPACDFGVLSRDGTSAAIVAQARAMARFYDGIRLWEDDRLRWTVIACPYPTFHPSPTFGIVYVCPISIHELTSVLTPIAHLLQGAALATENVKQWSAWRKRLAKLGVSYVCEPGRLQCPPLSWPENNKAVLGSLKA
jgi:hypothetical protein